MLSSLRHSVLMLSVSPLKPSCAVNTCYNKEGPENKRWSKEEIHKQNPEPKHCVGRNGCWKYK